VHHVVIWLVVLRGVSVVVGLVLWAKVEILVWRLIWGGGLRQLRPVRCMVNFFVHGGG
jgi:hypothetical protein